MRSWIIVMVLASSPALAATPPLCALPIPPAIRVVDHQAQAAVSNEPVPPSSLSAPPQDAPPLPEALASVPFIQHVASAGAVVSDLGMSHGVRGVAARNRDQFILFQVTPDGQAGVSGALTDLTPQQMATLAGGDLTELGTEHGLKGLFVRNGPQFQVFYVTPDQERLIPGVMWDNTGKDLTRQQVASVPGAIPTVVVGAADLGRPGSAAPTVAALPLVQKASFGTVGPASAPHLWMLIDPQCIYSIRAYQMLQPYVAAGKLQLSVIPLSVLDYEDQGQSTKSALALLSKPSDQIVASWQAGNVTGTPDQRASDRLRANMAIAQAIGLKGTPAFVWRKLDSTEGRIDGMPTNVDALLSSIGS